MRMSKQGEKERTKSTYIEGGVEGEGGSKLN